LLADILFFFFFSSRRRHTRLQGDWSSDVCSSDLSGGQDYPPLRSGGHLSSAGEVGQGLARVPSRFHRIVGITNSAPSLVPDGQRSEERRVGKEGRSRWSPDH